MAACATGKNNQEGGFAVRMHSVQVQDAARTEAVQTVRMANPRFDWRIAHS